MAIVESDYSLPQFGIPIRHGSILQVAGAHTDHLQGRAFGQAGAPTTFSEYLLCPHEVAQRSILVIREALADGPNKNTNRYRDCIFLTGPTSRVIPTQS